jgi:2-iminobutanoate/2-iminopropanoate deaminase
MKEMIKQSPLGVSAASVTDRLVFSSTLAIDVTTMKRVPEADTIEGEVKVCLDRLEANLAEAGLTLKDIVKTTCWVSAEEHRLDFAYAYRDLLAPGPYPSRALFVIGLAGDCRVQIDAIAARADEPGSHYERKAQFLEPGVIVDELVFADASALDPDTLERDPEAETIADETRICFDRLEQTLAAAGCTLKDLVKMNTYLTDDSYRAEFWETYNARLAPGPYPPRLTQVTQLDGDARVLLDAVAVRD